MLSTQGKATHEVKSGSLISINPELINIEWTLIILRAQLTSGLYDPTDSYCDCKYFVYVDRMLVTSSDVNIPSDTSCSAYKSGIDLNTNNIMNNMNNGRFRGISETELAFPLTL
jgi:hypothetical protein